MHRWYSVLNIVLAWTVALQIEEDEPTGFIRFEKFQPMVSRVLLERR